MRLKKLQQTMEGSQALTCGLTMWTIILIPIVIVGMIGLLLYVFLWGYFPGVPGVFSNDKIADTFNQVKHEFRERQIEPPSTLNDKRIVQSKNDLQIVVEKPKIEKSVKDKSPSGDKSKILKSIEELNDKQETEKHPNKVHAEIVKSKE